MRLGQYEDAGDTERLKLVERPADDRQPALVCNLLHQRLNLVDVLEVNTRDTSDEVFHSYFKNVRFFYTMSRLSVEDGKSSLQHEFSIIDGELTILRDGEVEYVFERDSLSRAAYQYMIQWIQDKKSPEDDPGTVWLEAEIAWDALSPEIQATLMTIANKEKQQALDIRDGLLATLHGYQGVKRVKDMYADCIRTCFSQLN
jgi:hypothetical protein